MVSLDLKDAYLQVPIHPDSRKYLRFVASGRVYQFKALCFGLSMAPQVFTRVMTPVAAILHRAGFRICRYLDDWLIQAASRVQVLQALDTVLHLCHQLGIVINWEKSHLEPSQRVIYLGVLLDSVNFRASPAQKRVEKLLSIGDEFLSYVEQPASSWLELLGVLASLIALVPGGHLRMRALQLTLSRSWDRLDDTVLVSWDSDCRSYLEWWLNHSRLEGGVSLSQVSPNLDASDVGWGAHLGDCSFRPLVFSGDRSIHQRQGIASSGEWTPLLRSTVVRLHSCGFRRQLYGNCLSSQSRRHKVSSTEFCGSKDSALGGVGSGGSGSAVYQGQEQRPCRLPAQAQ